MVQGLKAHLPMQGTWIQSLLRKDFIGQLNLCTTTPGSEHHSYQSLYGLKPILSNKGSTAMRSLGTATKKKPLTHHN